MLGATLNSVLNLVKSEVRASLSAGTADDALLKQAIETFQEALAAEYEWSELDDQWPAATVVGGQFIAVPTVDKAGNSYAINFDRDVKLWQKYNTDWQEVFFGITLENYNAHDSEAGEQQDPIQNWDWKKGDRSYFEVWPLPSIVSDLRFEGQRKLKTLRTATVLDGTKVLDLDDMIVALGVASEYLAGKPEQQAKLAKFNARFNRVRGGNKQEEVRRFMGGKKPTSFPNIRRVKIITTA